ncbi:permease [Desulfosporosinus sp. Sb-LF]|uniref:permease n=1 Tax=Desulfosporosinus sp. Sb-LF TaxID=2560027 RepID=UPI00107F5E07|nr:permease [Desulfosporosinus sp. Sb-LF]TGE32844.1 permease [Desulfosporosinus sp. Sb-LF]
MQVQTAKRQIRNYFPYVLLFAIIFVIGVWYVKWNPYYHKAFLAASKHSIGDSIISGKAAIPPDPSWSAAWNYAIAYFNSVWKAVILGLLLGSLVQILLPKNWISKIFGGSDFRSTALAGVAGIPSMMCTCCSAPVVVGLRERKASVGAAVAYWLGNPVLNPATIIFMGFVLSWKLAFFRIIAGIIMVFGIGYFANRWAKNDGVPEDLVPDALNNEEESNLFISWMRALFPLIRDTIPAYFIVVLILGAVRAWLFPAIGAAWANSLLAVIGLAIAGTLFIIPTAGEIPIVQSLMAFGLGVGPGVALLMTLPAISLPSLLMVKHVFPTKVLLFVGSAVALVGILSGVVAMLVF